ncbi:helix-turn-helix domain-containing protein [Phenylobacterium sp. J426]|uniref:helix-turn-helix domain-containing protein n=1 Tax=Phenylobacterium sp. J426 TaxID=2898439 RepID=UPI0021513E78|nr:helix-turn-helix transcriptional regulator [Phenylobacterium sp. J426]MCR5876708.1 helix-turn-helix domain-containing protein [Phenylobacterium sp. J426]
MRRSAPGSRTLRAYRGLTLAAMADVCGVAFQQLQKYENGANRISALMLARVAKALGVTTSEVLGEAEPATGVLDDVAELLAPPGAVDLLRAYAALPNDAARFSLLTLLNTSLSTGGKS